MEIVNLSRRKQIDYRRAVEEALNRRQHPYASIPILEDIRSKIGKKALRMIYQRYLKANVVYTKNQQSLKACTGSFKAQYSLPCSHVILERLEAVEILQLRDIDQQ